MIQEPTSEAIDIGLAATDKTNLIGHAYDGEMGQGSLTSIVTTSFDIADDGVINGKYTSTDPVNVLETKGNVTFIKGQVIVGKDKTLIKSMPGHENADAFTGSLKHVK